MKSFDAMRDAETNSFIGSRSLFENLKLISHPITVNGLDETALDRAFRELRGALSAAHIAKINEIVIKRYEYARSEKILCER